MILHDIILLITNINLLLIKKKVINSLSMNLSPLKLTCKYQLYVLLNVLLTVLDNNTLERLANLLTSEVKYLRRLSYRSSNSLRDTC